MSRHCRPPALFPVTLSLEQCFGARLAGILGYGSYFGDKPSTARDIDLIIALAYPVDGDFSQIRIALEKRDVDLPVQVQVLYVDEGDDPNLYSINTCGPFFLDVLLNATILSGINPFLCWPSPQQGVSDLSLLQKMQQYLYELQNRYFNLHRTKLTGEEWGLVKKRLQFFDDDAERLLGLSWTGTNECVALRAFLHNPARERQQLLPLRLERAISLCQSALKLARTVVYERCSSR